MNKEDVKESEKKEEENKEEIKETSKKEKKSRLG